MRTIILLLAWLSLSASALSQNLVAYYPFNGNANDQSGNHIDPTYTGGTGVTLTTDRFGNANKAYYFDGTPGPNYSMTGSYMRMPSTNLPTTNRTISLWFYTTDVSNMPGLLGYGGNGSCGTTLLMGLNCTGSGQYWVQGHCGANPVVYTYSTAPVNNWYHWVLTINGSTQKIYVNGELKSTANTFSGSTATVGVDFALGAVTHTNGLSPYTDANVGFFQGKLDDIRIYDNAMTDAQVQNLYANEAMVAYFPFNGNAVDETGNGNNSTYTGTGVTLTSDRFGNANKAYYFDGAAGSYIRVLADKFPTTDRTISFWFNADQLNYYIPTPFSYGGNVCNNSLLMIINHYNYTNSYLVESHCGANVISAPYSIEPVNNWYQLTLTISGLTQKIFVNGVLQQTTNSFTSPTYVTGTSALLGACINTDGNSVYDGYFKGKLDEFRIYNTAMTDAQVQILFNSESPGLVAYYPFNGNANDESGNGNNGTVNGATLSINRFGNSNKAYNFNGANNFISVADNPELFSDELTISWWYKVPEYSGTRVVIGWVNGGNRYQQFFSGNNLAYFNGYYNSCCYFNPTYSNMTIVDQWQHVVVTYKKTNTNESVTRLYINGELKQTDNHAAAITYQPGSVFFIGKTHDGGYFNGDLDDIRIYKRTMTDAQVQTLYTEEAAGGPLPVILLDIKAQIFNSTTARLSWQTAAEINNRGFEVQRSFDGSYFTDVRFVNGAGNSDVLKEYSITDIPGRTGRVYYRIKQIDVDGNSKLSNIVSVIFNNQGYIKVYPNPAQQQVTIEGIVGYNRLQLIDATGKLLKDIVNNKQYQINIDLAEFKNGLYFIRLMSEKETQTIKLSISN